MDECHNDNHAPGCQCHAGRPVMVDPFAADYDPVKTLRDRVKSEEFLAPADITAMREVILTQACRLISGDRQRDYGDARTDFTRTGKMWAAVLGLETITPEQVALCMALVKVGRLCETPGHLDSWVDICGYAALGGEIADEHGKEL